MSLKPSHEFSHKYKFGTKYIEELDLVLISSLNYKILGGGFCSKVFGESLIQITISFFSKKKQGLIQIQT